MQLANSFVSIANRVRVYEQDIVFEIGHPVLTDSSDRVHLKFGAGVVVQGRHRKFDNQENVFGVRVSGHITIGSRTKNRNVRWTPKTGQGPKVDFRCSKERAWHDSGSSTPE